jgi:hypothetical protein
MIRCGRLGLRPILNDEPWHLHEVTRVAGHEDCIACQGDRSDAKILRADTNALLMR